MPPKGHTIYSSMTSVVEYQVWVYKLRIFFCLKEARFEEKMAKITKCRFSNSFYFVNNCLDFSRNNFNSRILLCKFLTNFDPHPK